jgi:DNA-binding MarR family transcriptional regulator
MATEAALSDADYAALADFRYQIRRFQAFSERQAADCGLTPQQHQALLTIRGAASDGVSIGYVADRLVIKPHSASGLVVRLETLGLIARRASSDDARQALVELTPEALRLLAKLSETHREEVVRMRPKLTALLASLS